MKYLIVSLLVLISMCEKDNNDPCTTTSSNPNNAVCYEIYRPVCGCNNVTYSNDCYADASGVLSWTEGECQTKP